MLRRVAPWSSAHVAIAVLSVLVVQISIKYDGSEAAACSALPVFGCAFALAVLAQVTLRPRISSMISLLPPLLLAVKSTTASILRPLEDLISIQHVYDDSLICVVLIAVTYGLWLGSQPPEHIGLKLKLRFLAFYLTMRALSVLIRRARVGPHFSSSLVLRGDLPFVLSVMGMLPRARDRVRADRSAAQIVSNALSITLSSALRNPPVVISIILAVAVLSDVRGVTERNLSPCAPRLAPSSHMLPLPG